MLFGVREPKLLFTLAIAALGLLCAGAAQAAVIPTDGTMFGGAVTGDTQFKIDGSTDFGRSLSKDPDRYGEGSDGRLFIQRFRDLTSGSAAPGKSGGAGELNAKIGNAVFGINSSGRSKFQDLDIVQGKFGFDSDFTYLRIRLFGEDKVGAEGVRSSRFGESGAKRILISKDVSGAGSVMLSGKAAAFYQTPDRQGGEGTMGIEKRLAKTVVYGSTNGDGGGSGGVATTHVNPGSVKGFETSAVSDGTIDEAKRGYARRATGRPWVEFAFTYVKYNQQRGTKLDPTDGLPYLVFEANRGLKENRSYLSNAEYTRDEAGRP